MECSKRRKVCSISCAQQLIHRIFLLFNQLRSSPEIFLIITADPQKKKKMYRIKYIFRLSCVKTLARKHKSIACAFLKRVDSEFFQEFFTEEGGFISLIFPRASFALQMLYSGQVWYLDIIFINGLSNHEWLVMRPWKLYLFLNEWRDNKKIHTFLLRNVYVVRVEVDRLSIRLSY